MRTSGIRHVAVAALAAFALAACSSSSKTAGPDTSPATATSASSAATTTTTAPAGAATISLATSSKYGKILVDGSGMTLYVDENDKPGTPSCTGACLTIWPAVVAPASPTFGAGLRASMFTTVTAADGTKQLAVNGSPLYTFASDKVAGDATGQDVNGFYVVQANGEKYDPGAAAG